MKTCPICGKNEKEEDTFVKNYCPECFAKTIEITYKPLELDVCKFCGKLREGKSRVEMEENAIEKMLLTRIKAPYDIKKIKIEMKQNREKPNQLDFAAVLTLKVETGRYVTKEFSGKIGTNTIVCEQCNRKTSGYFEAIIQLRGDNRARVEQFVKGILKRIEEESFVAKLEEQTTGIDIYVGNKKAALHAVQQLKLPFTTASKLSGRREGQDLYRISFCVRI